MEESLSQSKCVIGGTQERGCWHLMKLQTWPPSIKLTHGFLNRGITGKGDLLWKWPQFHIHQFNIWAKGRKCSIATFPSSFCAVIAFSFSGNPAPVFSPHYLGKVEVWLFSFTGSKHPHYFMFLFSESWVPGLMPLGGLCWQLLLGWAKEWEMKRRRKW